MRTSKQKIRYSLAYDVKKNRFFKLTDKILAASPDPLLRFEKKTWLRSASNFDKKIFFFYLLR
jgi:hypothetical protein